MVFGNCGILSSTTISNGKGYVEMTGIDSDTSQDIADAVISKGGRYLEAQVRLFEDNFRLLFREIIFIYISVNIEYKKKIDSR